MIDLLNGVISLCKAVSLHDRAAPGYCKHGFSPFANIIMGPTKCGFAKSLNVHIRHYLNLFPGGGDFSDAAGSAWVQKTPQTGD